MSNEFTELSPAEQELIRKHRKELARRQQISDFRLKSIRVAGEYEKWLQDNGRGDSYSTFGEEFGYQDSDRQVMHEHVNRIRQAATPEKN